ncbi:MAG TPA: hypothetical protein VG125_25840, partial [Pirellulales bacterium]|nr:hypothetical protein [Pirellulales bacterium]
MAKKTARAKNPGGPFLAAAVLCENILKDSSGMSSIIHMLDNVTVQIHPQEDAHPQFIITLHLYLSFRTGSARGKHKITITAENPDGERKETSSETMEFGKEQHSSSNVEARVNLGV